jgi:hypothetical protein
MPKSPRTLADIAAEKARLQAEEAALTAPVFRQLADLLSSEAFAALRDGVRAAADDLPPGHEKTHADNWLTVTGLLDGAVTRKLAKLETE